MGVSRGYLDWGLRQAGRDRSLWDKVFPLGYPKPHEKLSDEKRWRQLVNMGVNPRARLLLFVGSMGRTYELAPCLIAAPALASEGYQLVLCGDGENRARWQALANGMPNVVFAGWQDADGLRCLMAHAWLGIAAYAPRAPQGLPNKIIEYISSGLPIVSSLEGETAALLSHHSMGAQYSAMDPEGFIRAVRRFGSPLVREQASARAQAVFSAEFDAAQVYRSFACFLERVAESGLRQQVNAED